MMRQIFFRLVSLRSYWFSQQELFLDRGLRRGRPGGSWFGTVATIQVRTAGVQKPRWPARSESNWAGSIAMTVFQLNVHVLAIRIIP
jgi:hypothetical protein